MTVHEKYIRLFIKFLKKEKLINDKKIYDYFIKYIKPEYSKGFLPHCWFNSELGNELKIETKYLEFIEDILLDDIVKMFRGNLYVSEINENELKQSIKEKIHHHDLLIFCSSMLHKSCNLILLEFYEDGRIGQYF